MRLTKTMGLVLACIAGASLVACTDGGAASPEQTASFDAAQLELRESMLAEMAESYGLEDVPEVELVRFVTYGESTAVLIGCLQEAGFPALRTSDGYGIDTSMVPETQSGKGGPLVLALYTCTAQYTYLPEEGGLLDDEGLSDLYDRYLEQEIPCLESYGVDVGEIPSRETFIDTYYGPEGWIPWTNVDTDLLSTEVYNEAMGTCSYAY